MSRATPPPGAPPGAPARRLRPYTLTGGRTRARHPLNRDSLLAARPQEPFGDVGRDGEQIQLLCASPCSLAELSGRLAQPVQVTKILVSDLLDQHALVLVTPTARSPRPDTELLEACLAGLRRL
ncbi:DUF742 domain-containing protein [Streptomyces sp. NPDC050485]|uniref:DUF742 domain-containing protein n=1 Tax=Streptomyces sp. NPDC050485 TaxID=3365617 RepID=UPI0037AA72C2